MTQRQCRQPYLALFDGADANASTAERSTTTVPTQALFFLNDPFVHELADKFAARILAAATDNGARIDLAHRIAYGRPATPEETQAAEGYLRKYMQGLERGRHTEGETDGGGMGELCPRAVRRQRVHLYRLIRDLIGQENAMRPV